jgi:hypothetical protein
VKGAGREPADHHVEHVHPRQLDDRLPERMDRLGKQQLVLVLVLLVRRSARRAAAWGRIRSGSSRKPSAGSVRRSGKVQYPTLSLWVGGDVAVEPILHAVDDVHAMPPGPGGHSYRFNMQVPKTTPTITTRTTATTRQPVASHDRTCAARATVLELPSVARPVRRVRNISRHGVHLPIQTASASPATCGALRHHNIARRPPRRRATTPGTRQRPHHPRRLAHVLGEEAIGAVEYEVEAEDAPWRTRRRTIQRNNVPTARRNAISYAGAG